MNINKSTVILVMFLLVYSASASAGLTSDGILDQVITKFADSSSKWGVKILFHAENLFFLLAPIGFVLMLIGTSQSLAKIDLSDLFIPLFQYGIYGGISFWFMEKGPEYAMSIIDSMRMIGSEASGTGTGLSVTSIVNMGFDIWHLTMKNLSGWSPIQSFVSVVLSLGILVILTLIAVNMMLLIISGWVLSYAGSMVLGFGAISQTRDIMLNYLKTVVGFGLQLMTMILLIGIGNDLLTSFYGDMNKGTLNLEEMGVLLVACIALFLLVEKVPPLIGGIISGASMGGGIGGFGAGAAMAGIALAQAAVAAGAGALTSGATHAAGVADALSAASDIGGGESGADPGMGSILNTRNQVPTGDGAAAFGQLMGDNNSGGGRSPSMGSHLTQGIKAAAQNKVSDMKNNFADKVAQTPGGQVAAAIRANDAAYNSSVPVDTNPDNSLSPGGNGQTDEYAAFVNKTSGSGSQDGGSNA